MASQRINELNTLSTLDDADLILSFDDSASETKAITRADLKADIRATGGDGMYEYQLNNDIWTTQNTFLNIRGCDENVIRARQINNCSIDAIEIFRVLNYPKFFTPNEDGFNDLWNIECLINQTAARIYIFDRFGKLLKTISPNGLGWNGTYNGEIMPSSDYWFRVDYLGNDGSSRTFTSHFTLKR